MTTPIAPTSNDDRIRLDKWLWYARFYKSRSLAAAACETGHIRVSGTAVTKPNRTVRPGDILTFPLGHTIRVVKVLSIGERRGPAIEARMLYEDLTSTQNTVVL